MDRSILVVCMAMILAISRMYRYPPCACRWVFIAGLYPWHRSCFPHRRRCSLALRRTGL